MAYDKDKKMMMGKGGNPHMMSGYGSHMMKGTGGDAAKKYGDIPADPMTMNNQGVIKTSGRRGQSLCVPVGKDTSDYAGKPSMEVPHEMKMGGGMRDLSHSVKGAKSGKDYF